MGKDTIQTKPVPLAQPVQLQEVAKASIGFNPIKDVKVEPSRLSKALSTLSEVVPEAATLATGQLNKRAEEDKTRQTNRALNDLEPSNDATKAGKTAHRMVDVRNQTNEMILQINEDAASFIGSAEDWEEHVIDRQNELFESTGQDEDTLAVTGAIFREQLPQSHLIKFRADQSRDQVKKAESMKKSFKDAVLKGTTAEEILSNIETAYTEGGAIGIAPMVQEEAITNAAIEMSVKNNDLRLIQITKALGIFEDSPALQEAERKARSRIQKQEQEEEFLMKEQLESNLYSAIKTKGLNKTDAALYLAQLASQRTGVNKQATSDGQGIWSAPQLAAVLDKVYKQVANDKDTDNKFEITLLTEMTGGDRFVDLTKETSAKQREIVDKYNEFHNDEITKIGNEDLNPAELQMARRLRMTHKSTWLAQTGLKDYQWEQSFTDFRNVTTSFLENTEGDELPEYLSRTIQIYEDLQTSPDALASHADAETISMIDNYQKNLANGATPMQALLQTKNQMAKGKVYMSPEMKKAFKADIASQVDDVHSSYMPTLFTGVEDITEASVNQITADITNRAEVLYGFSGDREGAIARAVSEYSNTHTILSNGKPVKGNLKFLATQMGVSELNVDAILTSLPARLEQMSREIGYEALFPETSSSPEDWTMEVTADGFVLFSDIYGKPLGRPITLSEAAGFSLLYTEREAERAKYAKDYYAEQEHRRNLESYGRKAPEPKFTLGKSPVALERERVAELLKKREEYAIVKEEKEADKAESRRKNRMKLLQYLNEG